MEIKPNSQTKFAWKLIHKTLLTKNKVRQIEMNLDVEYPFCKEEENIALDSKYVIWDTIFGQLSIFFVFVRIHIVVLFWLLEHIRNYKSSNSKYSLTRLKELSLWLSLVSSNVIALLFLNKLGIHITKRSYIIKILALVSQVTLQVGTTILRVNEKDDTWTPPHLNGQVKYGCFKTRG